MGTVIVGPGAVGGFLAARLHGAGLPVTLVGRGPRIERISRRGLRLIMSSGRDVVHRCPTIADHSVARDADTLIVAVKTHQTTEVGRSLRGNIPAGRPIVLVQNGVDGPRQLSEILGTPVLSGVAFLCARAEPPNIVRHYGGAEIVIGPETTSAVSVASLLDRGGVRARVDPAIQRVLWSKLATNCGLNALTALTQTTYGQVLRHRGLRSACLAAVTEAAEVSTACGVVLDAHALRISTIHLMEAMGSGTSSMASDLARSRETEVDALNGFVARMGRHHRVPTPVNSLLAALVSNLEGKPMKAKTHVTPRRR